MNPNLHYRNLEVERRKSKRDKADFLFEAHRDHCEKCSGKSYSEIKNMNHLYNECAKGYELAKQVYLANRKVAYGA